MAEASVRVEERLALSLPKRAAVVAAACGADMVINFPLWISAKRIAAGLPLPRAAEVYKGSGTLYFAMGPMTIVEDGATSIASRCLSDKLSSPATLLVSSCLAGGAGALVIGAQVENIITRAHGIRQGIWQTLRTTYSVGSWRALIFPPGLLMMMAREVPYSGCLFFLSDQVRTTVRPLIGGKESGTRCRQIFADLVAAVLTGLVAGPITHVPAVIASRQQAHAECLSTACRSILRSSGPRGFLAGLLPRTLSLAGSLFVLPFSIESIENAT